LDNIAGSEQSILSNSYFKGQYLFPMRFSSLALDKNSNFFSYYNTGEIPLNIKRGFSSTNKFSGPLFKFLKELPF